MLLIINFENELPIFSELNLILKIYKYHLSFFNCDLIILIVILKGDPIHCDKRDEKKMLESKNMYSQNEYYYRYG